MAVQFKMVAKQNNLVTPPQTKFYPCAVSKREIDLDSLTQVIASRSTMSKADCYGVIIALTEAIGEALADGGIVKIKSLGTFQITLQGLATESPESSGKSTIKGAKIVYKPSKEINDRLKNLDFKLIR